MTEDTDRHRLVDLLDQAIAYPLRIRHRRAVEPDADPTGP